MEEQLMTDLALTHYTEKPLQFKANHSYYQTNRGGSYAKPRGFWLSVDGEQDWAQWCKDEHFMEEGLAHRTAFRIKEDSQVLIISDMDEMYEFSERFGVQLNEVFRGIDWKGVSQVYDGIIITPYLWAGRYDPKTDWYYGWDCASGCIWNLEAIEMVTS